MSLNPGNGAVRELTADAVRPAVLFQETQTFAYWVYLLLAGSAVFSLGTVLYAVQSGAENEAAARIAIVVTAAVAGGITSLLLLRTRVDGVELHVALGLLPLLRLHVALGDIIEARVVEYRPLRDAGGWGMRFGRFEGHSCRYWNARGHRGVLVVTSTHRYIIGSQQPEDLLAALRHRRSRAR
jgi:hypothetical protein